MPHSLTIVYRSYDGDTAYPTRHLGKLEIDERMAWSEAGGPIGH